MQAKEAKFALERHYPEPSRRALTGEGRMEDYLTLY